MQPDLDLWFLVVICALATYLWRGLGVVVSNTIDVNGPVFQWLACVAYATLAALISRILFLPTGILESSELWQRLAATAAALLLFFLTGMNLFVGVIAGGAALVAITVLQGS